MLSIRQQESNYGALNQSRIHLISLFLYLHLILLTNVHVFYFVQTSDWFSRSFRSDKNDYLKNVTRHEGNMMAGIINKCYQPQTAAIIRRPADLRNLTSNEL